MSRDFHPAEMTYRIAKVRTLISTMSDYLILSSHDTLNGTPSGFSPGNTIPCTHPRENRRGRHCVACDDRGWRRRIPSLDRVQVAGIDGINRWAEIRYDEYDNARKPLGKESGKPRVSTPAEIDRAITRLERDADAREGRFESEMFPWERAKRARDRSGDYRHVERLLVALADAHPALHGALRRLYMMNVNIVPSPTLRALETIGLGWIAARMPGSINAPEWHDDHALRDGVIQDLYDDGWTPSKISRRLGVSLSVVKTTTKVDSSARVGSIAA